MSEWFPIDTAPKDGTVFDGHGHVKGQMMGEHRITDCAYRFVYAGNSKITVGKAFVKCDTGAEVVLTHWMPLPYYPTKEVTE